MNAERRRNNNNDGVDDVDPLADCPLYRYVMYTCQLSVSTVPIIAILFMHVGSTVVVHEGKGGRFRRAFCCLADVLYIHYTCIYHNTVALCLCVCVCDEQDDVINIE